MQRETEDDAMLQLAQSELQDVSEDTTLARDAEIEFVKDYNSYFGTLDVCVCGEGVMMQRKRIADGDYHFVQCTNCRTRVAAIRKIDVMTAWNASTRRKSE